MGNSTLHIYIKLVHYRDFKVNIYNEQNKHTGGNRVFNAYLKKINFRFFKIGINIKNCDGIQFKIYFANRNFKMLL